MPKTKVLRPFWYYACIGNNGVGQRSCDENSLPEEITCALHLDQDFDLTFPERWLIRIHFSQQSLFGDKLAAESIRLIERTQKRQAELDARNMFARGVRVFGPRDLKPCVGIRSAIREASALGYRLRDVHLTSYDLLYEQSRPKKIGERILVCCFELLPHGESMIVPAAIQELLHRPFQSCRQWVNLWDEKDTQVHCTELLEPSAEQTPRIELQFAKSLWWAENVAA